MEAFSALLAICAGNSPVPGEFPTQRPVTRSFDVFLDRRLNNRLSKQLWGWWFETLSCPLWRQCNDNIHSPSNKCFPQSLKYRMDIEDCRPVCLFRCSLTVNYIIAKCSTSVNSLRPRQNGHLFADDTFKRIFLNENIRISTFLVEIHRSLFLRVLLTIFQHWFW